MPAVSLLGILVMLSSALALHLGQRVLGDSHAPPLYLCEPALSSVTEAHGDQAGDFPAGTLAPAEVLRGGQGDTADLCRPLSCRSGCPRPSPRPPSVREPLRPRSPRWKYWTRTPRPRSCSCCSRTRRPCPRLPPVATRRPAASPTRATSSSTSRMPWRSRPARCTSPTTRVLRWSPRRVRPQGPPAHPCCPCRRKTMPTVLSPPGRTCCSSPPVSTVAQAPPTLSLGLLGPVKRGCASPYRRVLLRTWVPHPRCPLCLQSLTQWVSSHPWSRHRG